MDASTSTETSMRRRGCRLMLLLHGISVRPLVAVRGRLGGGQDAAGQRPPGARDLDRLPSMAGRGHQPLPEQALRVCFGPRIRFGAVDDAPAPRQRVGQQRAVVRLGQNDGADLTRDGALPHPWPVEQGRMPSPSMTIGASVSTWLASTISIAGAIAAPAAISASGSHSGGKV